MFARYRRHESIQVPTRFDEGQLGPDSDEWPGEQIRRLDDSHRSWRDDRYRRFSDQPAAAGHQAGDEPLPGDGAAPPPARRGSSARGR